MDTKTYKDALWHGKECIDGSYSVVRYVPSFTRGELLNIGIVLWTDDSYRIEIDATAVHRLKRDNVNLLEERLLSLRWILPEYITSEAFSASDLTETLQSLSRFPLVISEPMYVAVPTGTDEPLDKVLEWLIKTIVRPNKVGFSSPQDPRTSVTKLLRPLIKRGLVEKDYPVPYSQSGAPRKVDFFANHGANVGLDVVRMRIKEGEEIVNRADIEANRARDILAANAGMKLFVFCDMSDSEDLRDACESAKRVLARCGAIVSQDMNQVVVDLSYAALKSVRNTDASEPQTDASSTLHIHERVKHEA